MGHRWYTITKDTKLTSESHLQRPVYVFKQLAQSLVFLGQCGMQIPLRRLKFRTGFERRDRFLTIARPGGNGSERLLDRVVIASLIDDHGEISKRAAQLPNCLSGTVLLIARESKRYATPCLFQTIERIARQTVNRNGQETGQGEQERRNHPNRGPLGTSSERAMALDAGKRYRREG